MKTTTSIKLDRSIKDEASALAGELGLSLSSVVNATLAQFIRERRVVFTAAPEFNETTKKEFLKIRSDIQKGKNLSPAFSNTEDLFASLDD